MSTSVTTNPTGRVETDPAVLAVQEQRLPQLLATVKAGALCGSPAPGIPGPDDWYRGEGESILIWGPRREQLLTVCAACPVRAACEESALRQGEGSRRRDADMVRGGRTAAELFAARQAQTRRLAAAAAADREAAREDKELRRAWNTLLHLVSGASEHGRPNEQRNQATRLAVARHRELLAARRARSRAQQAVA